MSDIDRKTSCCIYVDVDDTFVRSAGEKRIPVPAVIAHVRRLREEGALLYCWSSGGAAYAEASAEEFGIADCFSGFLPKPHVVIDDQDLASWRRFVHIHPSQCSDMSLSDYADAARA